MFDNTAIADRLRESEMTVLYIAVELRSYQNLSNFISMNFTKINL